MENIFDANKDITKDDWKEIKNELKRQNFDSTEDFLSYALAVKILDSSIKISISETDIADVKKLIENFSPFPESSGNENSLPLPRPDEYETLYSAIAAIKIIDPTLKPDTAKIWNWATKSLAELKTNKNSRQVKTLTSLAFYMKIIDSSLDLDSIIGDVGWENIKKSFYESKDMDFAAKIKILNPEIDLNLNDGDWQLMKENLSKAREEKDYYVIGGFTSLASTMKILAADKATITEKGLEVIYMLTR